MDENEKKLRPPAKGSLGDVLARKSARAPIDVAASVDRLDTMLKKKTSAPEEGKDKDASAKIPILHDAVSLDKAASSPSLALSSGGDINTGAKDASTLSADKLNKLIDDFDKKLSVELDIIFNLLDHRIRRNIINELKFQLNEEAGKIDSSSDPE